MNIASKQIQWVLNKATPDIVLSKQLITLDSDNLTDTFTITTNSTGNLSVSSSDNSIATVSLSGNTATVIAKANGSCTITVNVAENGNYLSKSISLSVSVSLASTTLNDNSWSTISQIAKAGTASNYWSVGDTKEVILNGYVRVKSFSSYSCYATILGFDHNANLEANGGHSIHFIIGKDSTGKDICFEVFAMNEKSTISGGWNGSEMKQTYMPAFKNCLQTDLQTVLKTVTKYTDNTGTSSNSSSNVTATTEEIFLLSEFEVFGTISYANEYERNRQAQYAYYKNGNSKVRHPPINPTITCNWWLRSASRYVGYDFCIVTDYGSAGAWHADSTNPGLAPAFVV